MAGRRGRRTWVAAADGPGPRLSVRRLGQALIVTAAGELTGGWDDLLTAACTARTSAGMVVADLTGATAVPATAITHLRAAAGLCAERGLTLRVLVRSHDEARLHTAGLGDLVAAAGLLRRAVAAGRI